ncbi:MAG TPA: HNH endonuclease [Geothrix sp.]
MNFQLRPDHSVVLMSLRAGAPYDDSLLESGRVLIYEGHDILNLPGGPDPKSMDQPLENPSGKSTENGKFWAAAKRREQGGQTERVRVYEKIKAGIWAYNGTFHLVSAWMDASKGRKAVKFRMELSDEEDTPAIWKGPLKHQRMIPSLVKQAVWKRDQGRCVLCGDKKNLHFDHEIPFAKGGSSLVAENVRLLCARHNLAKSDKIE